MLFLLGLHQPLQEGMVNHVVLVVLPLQCLPHPVVLMVPGMTIFKLLLGEGDQPLEESCLILALVLMEPVHTAHICRGWSHPWGSIATSVKCLSFAASFAEQGQRGSL